MTDFAIYDMDRTVTRRATYTPFLLHCALRRAPWRLLLIPFVRRRLIGVIAKSVSTRLHGAAGPGRARANEDDVIDASYTELPPEPPSAVGRDRPEPPPRG